MGGVHHSRLGRRGSGWQRRPMLRRTVWRRGQWSRWLWSGPFLLLLFGSTAYKLHSDDARRVEGATGRPATSLTKDELIATMGRLGIRRTIGLSDKDTGAVAEAF